MIRLSETSKLDGIKSWSLQARDTCPGSVVKGQLVPACAGCYAVGGNYRFPNVKQPRLENQEDWKRADWVQDMAQALDSSRYFRWLDSGDIQSVDMLRRIALVCEATPHTSHWLPTREYAIVREYLEAYGSLPDNLTIRLSAMYFDKPVTVPKSLQGIAGIETSNAHRHSEAMGFECEASTRAGQCGECRHCFHRTGSVSYPFH